MKRDKELSIDIYDDETLQFAQPILEMLRSKIATMFGVTLQGNRLTIRWEKDEIFYNVHSVILEVRSKKINK